MCTCAGVCSLVRTGIACAWSINTILWMHFTVTDALVVGHFYRRSRRLVNAAASEMLRLKGFRGHPLKFAYRSVFQRNRWCESLYACVVSMSEFLPDKFYVSRKYEISIKSNRFYWFRKSVSNSVIGIQNDYYFCKNFNSIQYCSFSIKTGRWPMSQIVWTILTHLYTQITQQELHWQSDNTEPLQLAPRQYKKYK